MAKNKRIIAMYIFTGLFFVLIIARLFSLQIINGAENRTKADERHALIQETPAPRGNILDRYGRVLVKNKTGYYLAVEKTADSDKLKNDELIAAIKILEKCGKFDINTFEKVNVSEKIKEFNIDKTFTKQDAAKLAVVKNDMQKSGFSLSLPYVLCESADEKVLTAFYENQNAFKTIKIKSRPVREYVYPETASHILGRVSKISNEELKLTQNRELNQNDYIGKQGAEKAFEKYLRGDKGLKNYSQNLNLKNFNLQGEKDAKCGNDVVLTIDLDLQIKAEESLKKIAKSQKGAAAVAVDVNTGEVLVSASYPTYNIETFNEKYGELLCDKSLPLFNRALAGLYEPGSTFKPITAIAALDNGIISRTEKIKTRGKYEYKNHTFLCNIYKKMNKTHGTIDVSDALKFSCNYFFYDIGEKTGINAIESVAQSFGLDEKTGIELENEETKGKVAGREKREKSGKIWYPGDTLQASIGQSDNLFTPISLASFASALANGGTVYKLTILKQVNDSKNNEILIKNTPKIKGYATASASALSAVKEGMAKVCDAQGTAGDVFSNFDIDVCAKTGSAETGGSTNGVFICYAPSKNPQIAISVVLEDGLSGANAAHVARDILDEYFKKENTKREKNTQIVPNTLLP